MKFKIILSLTISLLASVGICRAAFQYSGGTYSENFNGLPNSGTSTTWANNSTLPNWYLYNTSGLDVTTLRVGTGSVNSGGFYSFGATSSTERALGGVGSGSVSGYIAVALENTSGGTLGSFTLAFDGEQWRNGGDTTGTTGTPAAPQAMVLEYGFGSTFASVTTWNAPGGLFNYSSPVVGATPAAVDGNVAGKVGGLGGTISSLSWANNEILWVRWIENNDTGNDHGLAIDNFAFSATSAAVPEPSTYIAGALLLLPFGVHGIRYFRNRKHS